MYVATMTIYGHMTDNKLIGEYATTEQWIEEQNEIADFIFGLVAGRNGKPADETKSASWLRGWAEAQSSSSPTIPCGHVHASQTGK
jgi:hypothetical protein